MMKINKEVKEEWKRFMESDEFNHNPECGTLLIAQHFAEWGAKRAGENENDNDNEYGNLRRGKNNETSEKL